MRVDHKKNSEIIVNERICECLLFKLLMILLSLMINIKKHESYLELREGSVIRVPECDVCKELVLL